VCKKYACECTVKTATKPPQPIAKSAAGASLLAQVIVGKFADHLPLHRQGKMVRRLGVDIADQTMCGWMRQSAHLLMPLYERLKEFVPCSKVTGTNDTPVRVLDRSLKGTTRKGRFWPYTGDREHPGVVFDYTPTRTRRTGRIPRTLPWILAGGCLCRLRQFFHRSGSRVDRSRLLGAHAPAFHEALDNDAVHMGAVPAYIAQLYGVEKRARDSGVTGEDLRLLRQQGSAPVSGQLHAYLEKINGEVLPKSEAGRAVAYALKNWEALTRYSGNGDLPIDNNHTERSLRVSRWDAATRCLSAATAVGKPWRSCAALCLRANC
jgi:hypothetical protein